MRVDVVERWLRTSLHPAPAADDVTGDVSLDHGHQRQLGKDHISRPESFHQPHLDGVALHGGDLVLRMRRGHHDVEVADALLDALLDRVLNQGRGQGLVGHNQADHRLAFPHALARP
jgi:hypothetical protein